MEKKEIIKLLGELSRLYIYVIEQSENYTRKARPDFYALLVHFNLQDGLCYAAVNMFLPLHFKVIKAELFKDTAVIYYNMSWYTPPYMILSIRKMVTEALQPRLDHLNRTIARLQQEIANDTTVNQPTQL